MVTGPFADFTWNQARQLVAERGRDGTDETAVARAVDDLLTRCERGPGDVIEQRPASSREPRSPQQHTGRRLHNWRSSPRQRIPRPQRQPRSRSGSSTPTPKPSRWL